ncbi:MAG: alpha/beta hydrolase family protein [Parachlamydiaceae bacterium]
MKIQYRLMCLTALQLSFLFALKGQDILNQKEKTAALIAENEQIAQEAEVVKSLYELDNNQMWQDITDKVLASPDTPDEGKESILSHGRRIILFKYPSDHLWIKGFISFTPEPKYHPLLVIYRWGNENFALMNPGVKFATYKDYTVISSALRGGVSEGEDEYGGKDIDDMENLIKYIPIISKEIGIHLNPSCLFMLGPSRGGMEMFLTIAHFPKLQKKVNKIVALSAGLDLHQAIKDRPDDIKVMFEKKFGMPAGANREEWIAKRDPLNTVKKIDQSLPILVVQGTDDDRISLDQGIHMVNALKETGHHVDYWEVKGGNHVLMNQKNIMNDIAHWLETNSPCMHIKLDRISENQ